MLRSLSSIGPITITHNSAILTLLMDRYRNGHGACRRVVNRKVENKCSGRKAFRVGADGQNLPTRTRSLSTPIEHNLVVAILGTALRCEAF